MVTALIALSLVLPNVPGAYNPDVRQSTLRTTVCHSGYSSSIRPPSSYTTPIKRRLLHGRPSRNFQLDHLISLSVGGSPRSLDNLWLQPIVQAHQDDQLENDWHRMLCDGIVTLRRIRIVELRWKETHG